MIKTKRNTIVAIIALMVMAVCMVPVSTSHANAKTEYGGFFLQNEVKGYEYGGVRCLRGKNNFTIIYRAPAKGSYEVDIYKVEKQHGEWEKKEFIKRISIDAIQQLGDEWAGSYRFEQASGNTYYRMYPCQPKYSEKLIPSAIGKTNDCSN